MVTMLLAIAMHDDDDNKDGWTPLMWAVSQEKVDLRIVDLMRDNGCDLM